MAVLRREKSFCKKFREFFRRFRENSWKKFDFPHRSDAMARPGHRELRAVKISASYDAWRPPKRRKNETKIFEKIRECFDVFAIIFNVFVGFSKFSDVILQKTFVPAQYGLSYFDFSAGVQCMGVD